MSFETLALHPLILKSVIDSGYTVPTSIQEKAIPPALEGKDILASAQTGTGKTAAFMLPVLHRLATPSTVAKSRGPRVLVLTPTRELAMQVSDCARKYGQHFESLSVVSVVGGVPYDRQRRKMARNVDIMVATPGRLMDYMRQGEIDFRRIEVLILDEADRMLDMGFRDEVISIADALPKVRQTLLFSATIDSTIEKIAQHLLKEPLRIEVTAQKAKHAQIEEKLFYVRDLTMKKKLLAELLKQDGVIQAIIFTATKRAADQLTFTLRDLGFEVAALHGDLRQRQRTRTIEQLQDGEVRFLVATDIAARGIDVRAISHIFNFDLPKVSEDYVHRIGRTGRAGEKGTAISIAYPYERQQVRRIETFVGHSIEISSIPGFETATGGQAPEGREFRGQRGGRSEGRGASRGGPRGGSRGPRPFGGDRGGRSDSPRGAPRSAPWSSAPRGEGSRNSDSRGADSRSSGFRNSGPRNSDSRYSESRNSESRNSEPRSFESRSSGPQNSDARGADRRGGASSRFAGKRFQPREQNANGNVSGGNASSDSRPRSEGRGNGGRDFNRFSRGGPSSAPRGNRGQGRGGRKFSSNRGTRTPAAV